MTQTTRPEYGILDDPKIPVDAPLVVAIDPGLSTGWAIWSTSLREPWLSHGQGPVWAVLRDLEMMLRRVSPAALKSTVLVVERFIAPARRRGRSEDATIASEAIGAVRLLAQQLDITEIVTQLPSERTIISRKLMMAWAWDSPTRGRVKGKDAISATQHLGSFLLRHGTVPSLHGMV